MQRKLELIPAALSLILMPIAAHAGDSGSQEIGITGRSVQVCRLSNSTQTGGGVNAQYSDGRLTIGDLIDQTTANVKSASVEITFGLAMCNYKASISLGTLNAGLVPAVPVDDPGDSFLKKVPYTITGTWGNLALPSLDTANMSPNSMVSREADGARSASLVLTVSTAASDRPLVAGDFSDTFLLKVGPTP